jgi:geranylgeranyl pyrophosphate synthase
MRDMVMRVQKIISAHEHDLRQLDLLGLVESKIEMLIQSSHFGAVTDLEGASRAAKVHFASGGSRVRARLGLHAGCALGLSVNDCVTLAATAELLHNASLVHDDLQDRDRLRRGKETVWLAFGDSIAICTGDLLISLAFSSLGSFSDTTILPELLTLVNSRICEAIHGQCADLKVQGGMIEDIATYERIVTAKSGALLSLPFELALIGSRHQSILGNARRVIESFAIGYQIVDDIDDVDIDAKSINSPGSLNIVHVMKALGHGSSATKMASDLGRMHLTDAMNAGAELPKGSGDFLIDLASKLVARL